MRLIFQLEDSIQYSVLSSPVWVGIFHSENKKRQRKEKFAPFTSWLPAELEH